MFVSVMFFFFDIHKVLLFFFFFQAEDGIRDLYVTGVQTVLFRSPTGDGRCTRPSVTDAPDGDGTGRRPGPSTRPAARPRRASARAGAVRTATTASARRAFTVAMSRLTPQTP